MMTRLLHHHLFAVVLVSLVSLGPLACHEQAPSAPAPSPSLSGSPSSSSLLPATSDREPIVAAFTDVGPTPIHARVGRCEEIVVAAMSGSVRAEGEELAAGDLLLVEGEGNVDLTGSGVAVVAAVRARLCDESPSRRKRVVRANLAPEIAWAGGAMRAHLDVEDEKSPYAYVGRLAGTAPVAEHAHAGAWEVLCGLEGAGTFTLSGVPQRLAPRTCVRVPPDVKHSWKPDEGTKLAAVQFYDPPGPEQRFKKLAQDDKAAKSAAADAGPAR
jgi:quercetin dioxygenase-like cupin family protein